MGMFSLLDAMMGFPFEDALRQIHLAPDIQQTLLGTQPPGALTGIYHLVKAYEQGEWPLVVEDARRLRVQQNDIRKTYLRAVAWCEEIFRLLPEFRGPLAKGHSGQEEHRRGETAGPQLKTAPVYSRR